MSNLRQPHHNDLIRNPTTGTHDFGRFPGFSWRGRVFASGMIHLRHGRHFGPHRGYGLMHIWREHFASIPDSPGAEQAVCSFITTIITPGAAIHYEGGTSIAQDNRSAIFRTRQGLAVIEQKLDGRGDAYYSVVTAYRSERVHGQRVGTL